MMICFALVGDQNDSNSVLQIIIQKTTDEISRGKSGSSFFPANGRMWRVLKNKQQAFRHTFNLNMDLKAQNPVHGLRKGLLT